MKILILSMAILSLLSSGDAEARRTCQEMRDGEVHCNETRVGGLPIGMLVMWCYKQPDCKGPRYQELRFSTDAQRCVSSESIVPTVAKAMGCSSGHGVEREQQRVKQQMRQRQRQRSQAWQEQVWGN